MRRRQQWKLAGLAEEYALDGRSQTSGADEHLQLNESSLWRGSRADRLNPRAHEAVPEIAGLLLDSKGLDGAKISAAEKMAQDDMIGIPPKNAAYRRMGDLLSALVQARRNQRPIARQLDLGAES